jgi:glycosyltransferase involved in cell wall biosynthesis
VHITAFPGGWLHDRAQQHDIPFHSNTALSNSFDPRKGLRAGRDTAKLAAEIRPDIIHCHSSAAGFWTRLAVRGSTPTVFTAHGWGFTPGAPRLRRIALLVAERLVSRLTARYICVSEQDGRLATRYGIAAPDKIAIIHNGVEPHGNDSRRSSLDAKIRAVFVGRLAKPKEPELLLAALSELPAPLRDAYELQIVGDGPLLPRLREFVLRNPAKVRLAGALEREEVLKTLSESHVFVLTSRYEGFPISILEAMSMGLAVIASDVGGVREAVTPECGILIGRGDKEALKRALTRLGEDRAAIERYGAAARERARKEFSVIAMCEKTLAVYESVLAR